MVKRPHWREYPLPSLRPGSPDGVFNFIPQCPGHMAAAAGGIPNYERFYILSIAG